LFSIINFIGWFVCHNASSKCNKKADTEALANEKQKHFTDTGTKEISGEYQSFKKGSGCMEVELQHLLKDN